MKLLLVEDDKEAAGEYYLSMAEAAFRYEGVVVFQIQAARRIDALPITRTYMDRAEAELEPEDEARAGAALSVVSPLGRRRRGTGGGECQRRRRFR